MINNSIKKLIYKELHHLNIQYIFRINTLTSSLMQSTYTYVWYVVVAHSVKYCVVPAGTCPQWRC